MTAGLAAFTSTIHGHCKISVAFTIMYILPRESMDEHISKSAREGGFRLSVTNDATLGKARLGSHASQVSERNGSSPERPKRLF